MDRAVTGHALAGVGVLLLLATTACASRGSTFAARFITEGTPTVNVGGVETAVYGQPPRPPRAVMPPVPKTRMVASRSSGNLSTLESSSPALARALAALAASPTSDHYLDVAAAYGRAGVSDRAYDHLIEGLRHDKPNVALHDALARVWRDWGFPDRALSSAHSAVYYGPRSPEARNTLGTVLWKLGQREQARQAFVGAVALDAEAWYAWRNLCTATLAAGRTSEAIAVCRRADAARRTRKESHR
jgi:tetratricopeptide (TPR) repeat protein